MDARTVIKSPVVTERSTDLTGKYNKYSFAVDRRANKIAIKKAVEELFKIKVVKVNTIGMRGKFRRVRFQAGKTPDWITAIEDPDDGGSDA